MTRTPLSPRPLAVVRYPVDALVRGDEPGHRSCTDSRDLVHLVRYLPENSGMRLVLRSAGGTGRVDAWFELFGPGADTLTVADLRYACGLSLVIGDAVRTTTSEEWPADLAHAYELERILTAPIFAMNTEDLALQPEWLTESKTAQQLAFAQPKPSLDSSAELLGALARAPRDTWVVTTLVPPTSLEQRLVLDEVDAVIGRDMRARYAGAIVCARTIVASSGPITAAVLAGLAKRSPEVEAVPLERHEAAALWSDPVHGMRGHAVAEGHAVALTRVPAAGSAGGIGMPSRPPAPQMRALDPALPHPEVGVSLGRATDVAGAEVEVVLDAQDLRRHLYVEGKSGSGKSAFLKTVATSWLQTGHPLVVIDPHGDVAQAVAAHAASRSERPMLYVRHGDSDHPIGLNPLAATDAETRARNVDALLDHMQQVIDPGREGMFGERAKRTFWLVAEAASHVYGDRLTIQVVQTLLLRQQHIRDLARVVEPIDADIARRLIVELVELADKEWTDLISWQQSRFQMWQRTEALRQITATGIDAIDLTEVLDGRGDLVVDLASPHLGDAVAGILGGMYLRKIREAMARRVDRGQPALVVFDEAHLFRDEAPDQMLAEGRKFGLALVIASQSVDNLTPRLARAIEANVGSFVSLRTGLNGAGAAAARLGGWPAGELTRFPDLRAAASLSSRGVPTDAFTLHVDYYDRLAAHGWTTDTVARRAEEVAQATLRSLWLPHSNVVPPSDEEILDVLGDTAVPAIDRLQADRLPSRARNRHDENDSFVPVTDGEDRDRESASERDLDGVYSVILDDCGPRPIPVIKTIREFVGADLAEAKRIADTPGGTIIAGVPWRSAHALVGLLRGIGATARAVAEHVTAPV